MTTPKWNFMYSRSLQTLFFVWLWRHRVDTKALTFAAMYFYFVKIISNPNKELLL